jgi:hypothetical protein
MGNWVTWKSACSVALPSVNRFFVITWKSTCLVSLPSGKLLVDHLEIDWFDAFAIWKLIG